MYYQKRNEEILVEYLESGSTLQVIGDKYGITRERVRQIVNRFGHERNKSKFLEITKVDWKNVVRIFRAVRMTNKAIASKVVANPETVKHILYGDKRYQYGVTAEKVVMLAMNTVASLVEVFKLPVIKKDENE